MATAQLTIPRYRCAKCKKKRKATEFWKRNNRPRGLHYRCKYCMANEAKQPQRLAMAAANMRRYRQDQRTNDPEKVKQINRKNNLKQLYGISLDTYEQLRRQQDGKCAICRKHQTKNMHVDHDHKTGKIRGLLCGPCNTSLGGFRDDIMILQQAIAYLTMTMPES